MRRVALLSVFLMGEGIAQIPDAGIAGPCTASQAESLPGVWRKTPDNLSELARTRLTTADRAKLVGKAMAAMEIIRQAYPDPRGVTVTFNVWAPRMPDAPANLPVIVGAQALFYKFDCYSSYRSTGQPLMKREPATDAWITVDLNAVDQGIAGSALPDGYELADGRFIFRNPIHLEGRFRGVPIVKGFPRKDVTVVYLARQERLLFRAVTREEILRVHLAYWQKKTTGEIQTLEKAVARHPLENARHRRMEGETDQEWETRSASHAKAQQSQIQRLAAARVALQQLPGRVGSQIEAMPLEDRRAPAVINFINSHSYQDLQWVPQERGGVPLITWDDSFIDKQLPRSAVHFLTVFWRRVPSQKMKEAAYDQLLAKLDLDALRALVD